MQDRTLLSVLLDALPAPPLWRYDWDAIEALAALRPVIDRMASSVQDPVFHGEGDVWTHTRLVCEALARLGEFRQLPEKSRRPLALAALLHDMGKPGCTRMEGGRVTAYFHGRIGSHMARTLLWLEFGLAGTPEAINLRETCCALIRDHMLPFHLLDKEDPVRSARRFAAIGELASDTVLSSLILLAEADALGRVARDQSELMDALELARGIGAEAGCLNGPFHFASALTREKYFQGTNVWPDQALYDDSVAEAILMSGLPGVGKDTYIRNNFPNLPVVSMDVIRRRMDISPRDDQGRVVQAAKEEARVLLRQRQPFVWNATSLTRNRSQQIGLFGQYGFRTRVIYLETPWQENLRRNADRKERVPENVLTSMLDKLELPQLFEAREVEWVAV